MKKETKELLKYILQVWSYIIGFLFASLMATISAFFIAKLLRNYPIWVIILLSILFISIVITTFICADYKKSKKLENYYNNDKKIL